MASPEAAPVLADRVAARLEQVAWTDHLGPFRALDFVFGVRTNESSLPGYLAPVLAPFRTEGPVTTWYSVLDRGEGRTHRYATYIGSRRLAAGAFPDLAVDYLLWSLNQEVVATATGCVLIHAAAAERDGSVVLLPAAPSSGKTTTVTGLLRRGFRYLTDETVALDVTSVRLRPFPKAVGLEMGSWPLFPDLAPVLAPGSRRWFRDKWHVPPAAIGAELATGGTPRLVVSPAYRAGSVTELTWISRAAGLGLLAACSFNPAEWGRGGLEVVAGMLRGCRCATLTIGDLDTACGSIEDALAVAGRELEGGGGETT